jgi:hypothetical protein
MVGVDTIPINHSTPTHSLAGDSYQQFLSRKTFSYCPNEIRQEIVYQS